MSKFHLGWFMGHGVSVQGWNEPGFGSSYDWTKPDLYQDCVRALERACFDVLVLEDASTVPYAYKNSMDYALKHAVMTPKFDPLILTPYLAAVTKHIGLAPSLTTTFYPPWLLARALSTMDHYSSGRIGWNIVTATSDAAAQNFGYDKLFDHDQRYDMADEYVDVAVKLWDAWEPDAVVMDAENDTFIDPSKVKALHFEGKYYKTRGPLNVPRSPQGRPVFVVPGGSPRGRKFSGRNAEIVLAAGDTIDDMKIYRQEVLQHALEYGRDPSAVKMLFVCIPTVVRDAEDAEEYKKNLAAIRARRLEHSLATTSFVTGIDFSTFDLDGPVGELSTNGLQNVMRMFKKYGPDATLREIMNTPQGAFNVMVGTPDSIAGQMQDAMEEIGGDGFLINGLFKPSYVTSIVDELVPALQKRGLTRTEYGPGNFRDHMMAF